MNTQNQPPYMPNQPARSKRTGLVVGIIIGVLVIILLGIIAFMLMPNKTRDNADLMRERAIEGQQTADQVRQNNNGVPSSSNSTAPTPTNTTTQTNTSVKVTTPVLTPTTTVAVFAGEWNGTYASSPITGAACNASGAVSFSIKSSGSIIGYAVIKGRQVPGTGSVDKNGNLSGTWNYTGGNLSWTGKINNGTNTGNGTYRNAIGCFGSFSISR